MNIAQYYVLLNETFARIFAASLHHQELQKFVFGIITIEKLIEQMLPMGFEVSAFAKK